MLKKTMVLFTCGMIAIIFAACNLQEKKGATPNKLELEKITTELKSEAKEVIFAKAKDEIYQKGDKLKVTGDINSISKAKSFPVLTISTKKGLEQGLYTVQVIQDDVQVSNEKLTLKNNTTITKGDRVTIFGYFEGNDGSFIPQINATIVEKNK